MKIYWIEFKLLDKSTNHPTETEMIKQILYKKHKIKYYCGYKSQKKNFGLNKEVINYINMPSMPKLRILFLVIGILNVMIKALIFIKPDAIIIDYSINLMTMPILLIRKIFNQRTKIILDIRTLPVNVQSFRWRIKIFLFSLYMAKFTSDGITFITPFMREFCSKHINLLNKKTSFWTSGFNDKIFNPDKYQTTKVKDRFKIFYHGGLSISRGIGSLIQSVEILKDKNYPVSLELIGNIVDEKEIKSLVYKSKLERLCKILPPVSYEEIPQMIKDCDLPVIPLPDFIGWRVSSPIKLIEYMAMGKSMVLTDIEAHRNVAGNYEFAFFAESAQPEDIARAIEQAYERKNDLDEFGKNARSIALSSYTWEHQANRLISFLQSL